MDVNGAFEIPEGYIRDLVNNCQRELAMGRFQQESAEGIRVADNFRKFFPNVSDHDLGAMIVIIVQMLRELSYVNAFEFSGALALLIGSYSYSAADILKTVIDLGEL